MTDLQTAEAPPVEAVQTKDPIADLAAFLRMETSAVGKVLMATIFPPGANSPRPTVAHVQALCSVAYQYRLNPLTRQIYAFPTKGGGIVPMISVDGWLAMAERHPQMDGMEVEYIYDDAEGVLVACKCTVYRKDRAHPITAIEYLSECKRNTDPWTKQPHRMLGHRARIQAIRVAFGISASEPEDEPRIPAFDVYPPAADPADAVADLNALVEEASEERPTEPEVEQLCAVPDCGKPKREHKSNQLKHSFASPDLWGGTDDEEQEDPA